MKMMNQKGDVMDVPVIGILVIVMAFTAIIGTMVLNQLRTDPSFNDTMPEEAKTAMEQAENATLMFDMLIVFLFFSAIAVGVISAALVPAHPVFFILYFIVMLIMAALSTIFSNVYYEFASSPLISAWSTQFPWIALLMQHLPQVTLVGMVLIAIVMFGKTSSGGVRY